MILVFSAVLVMACASVQEKQALSDWKVENQQYITVDQKTASIPELADNPTLEEYILYAILNNPGLHASFDRWKAALEGVSPARTLPDPRFTYAKYIEEVETRVGSQQQKFGLAQTFPWFGKLDLQGKMALQDANVEQQRYEALKLKLIYEVKKIYAEYWYLARSIDITRDNVSLISHFKGVARAKYISGAGLQSAVIKIQVELGKLEDRLRSQEDMIRPVAAKLNFLLNRPSNMPLPLPETLPADAQKLSNEALKTLVQDHNPDLKAVDFMAAKEDLAVQLAGKNYYPDLTLGLDVIDTKAYSNMNPEDNGQDPVIAMVSINVPIWYQKYKAMENAAAARRRALLNRKQEKQNALFSDLEMSFYKLRDAVRKMDLYKNTLLPMAEQNIKVNQSAFSADKVGFLDLIDSQRIFLGFQLEHERARADRAQRLAEIDMLTGQNPDLTQSHRDTKEKRNDPGR